MRITCWPKKPPQNTPNRTYPCKLAEQCGQQPRPALVTGVWRPGAGGQNVPQRLDTKAERGRREFAISGFRNGICVLAAVWARHFGRNGPAVYAVSCFVKGRLRICTRCAHPSTPGVGCGPILVEPQYVSCCRPRLVDLGPSVVTFGTILADVKVHRPNFGRCWAQPNDLSLSGGLDWRLPEFPGGHGCKIVCKPRLLPAWVKIPVRQ